MNKKGPIMVIDDDRDDRDILAEVFAKLNYPNAILNFSDGEQALEYLKTTDEMPFLIFSDINMPKIGGLELRTAIENDPKLRVKGIPFVFFTTATSQKAVLDVYAMTNQGFFIKPNSFNDLEALVRKIIEYWRECVSPADFP